MELYELMEVCMIVSFGCSWPVNVIKSYKVRTTKGKSLAFLVLISIGYVAGIISKFMNETYMDEFATKWYVLIFYCINLVMVCIDILLYFRNCAIDKKEEKNLEEIGVDLGITKERVRQIKLAALNKLRTEILLIEGADFIFK
jgi:surface polysaccharide O-acyltransferase-like enzyme